MSKYKKFEICDGDYNDVTDIKTWKEALGHYRNAATPRSLYGIDKKGNTIPIYAKR